MSKQEGFPSKIIGLSKKYWRVIRVRRKVEIEVGHPGNTKVVFMSASPSKKGKQRNQRARELSKKFERYR